MITNPSHRPLHSQVATLVAEREELFDDQDALREENASLKVQLEAAREQIHHLEQRHELVCSNGHALEEECRTLQEAVELFGTQATSANAAAKEAEARLADSEARCMKLHSEFVRTANGLHSERSAHDTDEAAHATAMEALRAELEAHDAELADRDLRLLSALGECRWLRDKLSYALNKQRKAAQALREEQMARAAQSQELTLRSAQLEAELRLASEERRALGEALEGEKGAHRQLTLELDAERHTVAALRRRCDQADEARVDALVYADRADHALICEQASAERAAALQGALVAHFDAAARALEQSALAVERMRFTHSNEQRHAIVERTWAELCKRGASFGGRVPGLPPEPSSSSSSTALQGGRGLGGGGGGGAEGGGANDASGNTPRGASDVALAASAHAFARGALALAASAARGSGDAPRLNGTELDSSPQQQRNRGAGGLAPDGLHGTLALLAWGPATPAVAPPTWSHGERRRLEMDGAAT